MLFRTLTRSGTEDVMQDVLMVVLAHPVTLV